MTTEATITTRRNRRAKVHSSVRIPLSVLASLPEKLRVLAESIKIASGCRPDDFKMRHTATRTAYDDANGSANNAVNSFGVLESLITTAPVKAAVQMAREAQSLTSAIYKATGNIHNDDNFRDTFKDQATVDATVTALHECGDAIRAIVRPFGY